MPQATTIADKLASYPLVTLLRRETNVKLRPLIGTAAISAFSNVLVLAIINNAAGRAASQTASTLDFFKFLVVLLIYNISQRHILVTAVVATEGMINRLRTRIAEKIRHADLTSLEAVGRSQIFTSVTRDTVTLSNTSPMLVIAAQSLILVAFIAGYLAFISLAACLLAVVLAVLTTRFYVVRSRQAFQDLRKASLSENEFFDTLEDTLHGFKEVKLNRWRGDELFAHTQQISRVVMRLKVDVMSRFTHLNVFGTTSFYLLMGAMVFVLPRFTGPDSDVMIKSTAAILFLIGPVTALANVLPVVTHASVAAGSIMKVEEMLDRQPAGRAPATEMPAAAPRTSFREIRFERVVFEYKDANDASTFRLGPIDFVLTAGETLFLVGGNGSGKSTLLLLLTGLRVPQSGSIFIDGDPVNETNAESYRSLFSTVLADYHLFKRLYGLSDVPVEVVDEMLRRFEIGNKTRTIDHRFQSLDLSTGQRKRLALAVAMLENRPIYVFDEWAAEQDSAFRARFYNDILPRLKQEGKTVVVVTHDDRYFHADVIDRVLKLEQGQFAPFEAPRGS